MRLSPVQVARAMGSDIVLKIRKRAGDVRQDGQYCGLFELTVWAALKELRVLCSFGTSILNVHHFCGRKLPTFKSRGTIRVAAVYCTADGCYPPTSPVWWCRRPTISWRLLSSISILARQRPTRLSGGTSHAEGAGLMSRRLRMISVGYFRSLMLWGIA